MPDPQRAIARILADGSGGAGVLIVGGYVVTCAHVVEQVCKTQGLKPKPGTVLQIDFPFERLSNVKAKIVAIAPSVPEDKRDPDQPSDLAVLEVTEDVGFQVKPQKFETSAQPIRCEFETWGFPSGATAAAAAFGTLNGKDGGGWLYAYSDDRPFILKGFSGAPVFVDTSNDPVGICALRKDGKVPIAGIIPGEQIMRWLRAHVSPYPGKHPFRALHAELYSSHGPLAVDLQEQVCEQRVVALIGPKQTGRTSLLRAGLNKIRNEPRFGQIALVDTFTDVPNALQRACGQVLQRDWRNANLVRVQDELTSVANHNRGLLLIVDALERFTTERHISETRSFLECLAATAHKGPAGHIGVIIVVDQDQRSVLQRIFPDGLGQDAERAMPERLSDDDLKSSIVHPAQLFGVRVAPTLVRRITNQYNWDRILLSELSSSLHTMWRASAGSDVISERAFLGFGIERALQSADGDNRLRRQEAKDQLLLQQLLTLQQARKDSPAGTLPKVSSQRLIELRELAEQCEPILMSADRLHARLQLEQVRLELVAALEQSAALPDQGEEGLRLAGALHWFWNFNADFAEGIKHLETLLNSTKLNWPSAVHAKACYASGTLSFLSGNMQHAKLRLGQSVIEWRTLAKQRSPGAERSLAYALVVLGRADKKLTRARWREELAVDIMGKVNDDWGLALALNDLGFVLARAGEYPLACEYYGRSFDAWRRLKDLWGLPLSLVNYGAWAIELNDLEFAETALRQALEIHKRVGDRWELPNTLRYQAELDLKREEPSRALCQFLESLRLAHDLQRRQLATSNLLGIARCIVGLAKSGAELEQAAKLFGAWDAKVRKNKLPGTFAQVTAAEELRATLDGALSAKRLAELKNDGAKLEWPELLEIAGATDAPKEVAAIPTSPTEELPAGALA